MRSNHDKQVGGSKPHHVQVLYKGGWQGTIEAHDGHRHSRSHSIADFVGAKVGAANSGGEEQDEDLRTTKALQDFMLPVAASREGKAKGRGRGERGRGDVMQSVVGNGLAVVLPAGWDAVATQEQLGSILLPQPVNNRNEEVLVCHGVREEG